MRITCHKTKGRPCRHCARPGARTRCVSDLRGAKPYAGRARKFDHATIEKNYEVGVVDVESDSSSSEGYARSIRTD